MICDCCPKILSDYEATLKSANTGEYLNTCVKCLKGLSIPTIGRDDLLGKQEAAEGDVDNVYIDEYEEEDFLFEDEED